MFHVRVNQYGIFGQDLLNGARRADFTRVRLLLSNMGRMLPDDARLKALNYKDEVGATPLHWTVWRARRADGLQTIVELIEAKADPNAKDNDGQPAVKWADVQGYEEVVELLNNLGARSAFNKVLTLHAKALPRRIKITCTTLGGQVACPDICLSENASIADLRRRLVNEIGLEKWDMQLTLANGRLLDATDESEKMCDVFYPTSPLPRSRRLDRDGRAYTRQQFLQYYGTQEGQRRWEDAEQDPDDIETALAMSQAEAIEDQNGKVSRAIVSEAKADDASSEPSSKSVVLLKFNRCGKSFHNALLGGEALAPYRNALAEQGFAVELPSRAKVFVDPCNYKVLIETLELENVTLHQDHVIVEPYLEQEVIDYLWSITRPKSDGRAVLTLASQESSPAERIEGTTSASSQGPIDGTSSRDEQNIEDALMPTGLGHVQDVVVPEELKKYVVERTFIHFRNIGSICSSSNAGAKTCNTY
eukprot:TRINITY_DN66788_c0_g1_i1.p1 TRINITY_DN66788_c0_g1~~TRINITY_DN66788_c0_g1_i1.p1  ORF type:complete len:476 (+),score=54.63 TRINITY_DN66788_c0_g1_i1:104-1531(+)